MKVIVLEVKDRQAIVLDQRGYFHKLCCEGNCLVGAELEVQDVNIIDVEKYKKMTKLFLSVFASLLILFGIIGFVNYFTPEVYITLDVNPSLQLEVNRMGRVINVDLLNEDAQKLSIKNSDYGSKKLDGALDSLIREINNKNYLNKSPNLVVYTVFSKDEKKYDKIYDSLDETTRITFSKIGKKYNIVKQRVAREKFDEARRIQVSPAKLMVYEELCEYDRTLEIEKISKLPLSQSMQLLSDYKKIQEAEIKLAAIKSKQQQNNQPVAAKSRANATSTQNNTRLEKVMDNVAKDIAKGIHRDLNNKASIMKSIISDIVNY